MDTQGGPHKAGNWGLVLGCPSLGGQLAQGSGFPSCPGCWHSGATNPHPIHLSHNPRYHLGLVPSVSCRFHLWVSTGQVPPPRSLNLYFSCTHFWLFLYP